MSATMTTYRQLINRHNLKLTCDWADENPNMPNSRDMNHWKCTLRHGRKQMTFHFSQGYGISHDPEIDDVLDCLASDAADYENAPSFEDWADEYGYDTDSRTAEHTWRAVAKQTDALRRVMGDDLYNTLLWDTERL